MKSAIISGLAASTLIGGVAIAEPAPDKATGALSDPAANASPKAPKTPPVPDASGGEARADATPPRAGTDKSVEDNETGNNADRDNQGSKSAQ